MRRAVARLEIPWPVAIDTDLEVWDIYGNEGWPARYLWDPEQIAALACTTARAPTRRPSARSRRCSASSASRSRRCARRTRRTRCSRRRPTDQPGAYSRPLRGRRRVGGGGRRRRADASTAARWPCASRAASRSLEHPPPHRTARSSCEPGAGVTVLRHLLHAGTGGADRRVAAVAEQVERAAAARRPRPGPRCPASTGERSALGGEEVRLVDPGAGVVEPRRRPR